MVSQRAYVVMTMVLSLSTMVALASVSPVAAALFAMLCLFVTFICPAWLLWLQPFKKYETLESCFTTITS